MGLQAGVAAWEIRVPAGIDLTGYIARQSASTGIHDPLFVKCMVLWDGLVRVALVLCDLLGLDADFTARAVRGIGEATGIPADRVVVACTHTHSGPASIHLEQCGEVDASFMDGLCEDIVRCAAEAGSRCGPVLLRYRIGDCDVARNRTIGDPRLSLEFRDTGLSALEVLDGDSRRILAVLVNFACHPVTLTADNTLVSRDFIHYLEESVRRDAGPGAQLFYLPGCCGDLDPIRRGGFGEAEATGECIAQSLHSAAVLTPPDFNDAALGMEGRTVTIPLDYPRDRDYFGELHDEYRRRLEAMAPGDSPAARKGLEAFLLWSGRMRQRMEEGTLAEWVSADIRVFRIGSLTIVWLPFEAFHDIGLRIRECFGPSRTMVVGYANGLLGYLPSEQAWERARYEAGEAYKYYGYPGPFAKNAEKLIMNPLCILSQDAGIPANN